MKAVVIGVAGQDGSYLAEFLLRKGYEVLGLTRFHSAEFGTNLHVAYDLGLRVMNVDITDSQTLVEALARFQPDEVYNLAALSYVGASWDSPGNVMDVNAKAVANLIQACRVAKDGIRLYQASSSEMFGNTLAPEGRKTDGRPSVMLMADDLMKPRSPYGVSKMAAHHLCRVARESHGQYVVGGICFNHECISATTALLIRKGGMIDISSPEWIGPYSEGRKPQAVAFDTSGLEVWDGADWTRVLAMTGKPRRTTDADHAMLLTIARSGSVETTASHNLLSAEGQKTKAVDVAVGSRLLVGSGWPEGDGGEPMSLGMARFLGYMTADGYVSDDGSNAHYTKNDDSLRAEVSRLWRALFCGTTAEGRSPSGFSGGGEVSYVRLTGASAAIPLLRSQLYMPDKTKRVAQVILNADRPAQEAFLDAYYAGDGLKAFGDRRWAAKTNSPYLALGLIYLAGLRGMPVSAYVEDRDAAHRYYQLNGQICGGGAGATKDPCEVRETRGGRPTNMVYDLETESGCLMAGVGRLVISNSERRGVQFVTRKIAVGLAAVKKGIVQGIPLGTLDAHRDWGYAPEYIAGMWRMLQQPEPHDFILATGKAYSVRDFLNTCASFMDLPKSGEDYAISNQAYLRPAEVWTLVGDTVPAELALGWKAEVEFEELVGRMAAHELMAQGFEPPAMFPPVESLKSWTD